MSMEELYRRITPAHKQRQRERLERRLQGLKQSCAQMSDLDFSIVLRDALHDCYTLREKFDVPDMIVYETALIRLYIPEAVHRLQAREDEGLRNRLTPLHAPKNDADRHYLRQLTRVRVETDAEFADHLEYILVNCTELLGNHENHLPGGPETDLIRVYIPEALRRLRGEEQLRQQGRYYDLREKLLSNEETDRRLKRKYSAPVHPDPLRVTKKHGM